MIKGVIQADHVQLNKYQLLVAGLPPILFTEISGIEEELQTTVTPDQVPQTGGRVGPIEFDVTIAMHHNLDRAAMELWYREGFDPVSPFHKKLGTLIGFSQSRLNQPAWSIHTLFPFKRGLPDWAIENEGEMAGVTWGMKASEIFPLT